MEGVDKRIDVFATTLRFHGTVQNLQELELAYAPPFSSAKDPVNIAGYAASNILSRQVKTVQIGEVNDLRNKAFFLDVRETAEHLTGAIEGSVNIPLPQLRTRLTELPTDTSIVVYCRVGHQAYIASCLLLQMGFEDVYNLAGGWRSYSAVQTDNHAKQTSQEDRPKPISSFSEIAAARTVEVPLMHERQIPISADKVLDVTGLACPGPIAQVHSVLEKMNMGSVLEVHASDPGFASDIAAWCSRTGNSLLSSDDDHGLLTIRLRKGEAPREKDALQRDMPHDKTIVVFSGDLDKALAAFVIATGAVAMNRKVTLFFTFWGLSILRRSSKQSVTKSFMDKMFGMMMPRGSRKLGLSRMNMGGVGPQLIRSVMKGKRIASLEELMQNAINSGVRIVACQMSMDVMGIKKEELIAGVEIGGVATYLAAAEEADTNLFI
jgi:peroxiredoxin family protein/rhodanese-related sulfurtransferase/TusA-related sulfurtransferase